MEDPEGTREESAGEQATEVLDVASIRAGTPERERLRSAGGGSDEVAEKEAAPPAAADERRLVRGNRRTRVPAEILDASFSLAIRGYDRAQVDAYVERVERVVAALQRRRSPESAVKVALDRVGVQTAGVLQRAREAAEEIAATARADAEHVTRRASIEAEETLERAVAEASALREQATREADELVSSAGAEAEDRLREAEERAATARSRAEKEISTLTRDVERAGAMQRRALDELRATASEVEEFAASVQRRRAHGEDRESPNGDADDHGDGGEVGDGARPGRITRRREPVGIVDWAASADDSR